MKTRTNQPIYKDDGTPFTDGQLDSDIAQKGGTKLYKHSISDNNYLLELITTVSQPIDFTLINTYAKFITYLKSIDIISFLFRNDSDNRYLGYMYFLESVLYYSMISDGSLVAYELDDFIIANATDTVTEL